MSFINGFVGVFNSKELGSMVAGVVIIAIACYIVHKIIMNLDLEVH